MSMDVDHVAEPTTGERADSIRITRHGKLGVWVKKALEFLHNQPDRPLVLYSPPADVAASTIARLISVVEIVKREYLKGQGISTGDAPGLHQYNQLLFEQQGKVPVEEGEDRADALCLALDGQSYVKQSFAPHMKITLSVKDIAHRDKMQETHQAPAVRGMSKTAKARMRKRLRKQREMV